MCGSRSRSLARALCEARKESRQTIDLSGINCRGAKLSGVNLQEFRLAQCNFDECLLAGAKLARTDLTGASLRGTVFQGADLRDSDLSEADLSGADLTGARVGGANFTNVNVGGAILSETPGLTQEQLDQAFGDTDTAVPERLRFTPGRPQRVRNRVLQQLEHMSDYFRHETAIVDAGVEIGPGSKIWHFAHILSGSKIGANCNLGQNVMVGPNVQIGNGCKIQNNVAVYEGVTLEDDVFCGPSMVFTNVLLPRAHVSRLGSSEFLPTLIKRGASVGCQRDHRLRPHDWGLRHDRRRRGGHTRRAGLCADGWRAGMKRIGWVSRSGDRLNADLVCPRTGERYRLESGKLLLGRLSPRRANILGRWNGLSPPGSSRGASRARGTPSSRRCSAASRDCHRMQAYAASKASAAGIAAAGSDLR